MAGVEGRVVIVSGAGGGLGRSYALALADAGARVVVNDLGVARDGSAVGEAMADRVVEEIRGRGGEAIANRDSVATASGAAAIVATALEAFGALHGVINNAGILRDASFAKMTDAEWDAVQAVHLGGAYHLSKAAWSHLREQGFGRILMATSTSGLFGNFGQANYAAAKLGMVGLAHTLAIEGERAGVRVNCIAPMAATRMTEGLAPAEVLAGLSTDHVAPVAVQLMSEECEQTGCVYVVGGGRVYRVAQFQNEGVVFAEPPTQADVAAAWERINDLDQVVAGSNPVG